MANAAALIWGGIRHPARTVLKHWPGAHTVRESAHAEEGGPAAWHASYPARQSPERLERIATYARSGYFHMDYTAGLFVVPLDIPPE